MQTASSDRRDQFIRERKYLLNISDATESWYRHALWKWLPSDLPSDTELKSMVIRMREAGLKATGCNAAIRAINAYLRWAQSPHRVSKLKEPQTVMPTFTEAQVSLLLKYRATSFYGRRLQGGDLFRVIAVDDEGVLMTRIKPKPSKKVFYTRHVKWENFKKHGYELVFP